MAPAREVIDLRYPLEELSQTEAFTGHLALRVELGQLAETLLVEHGLGATVLAKVRAEYPIPVPSEDEVARNPDNAEARFARVVAGRCCDGLTLYRDAVAAAPALPVKLTTPPNAVPSADRQAVARRAERPGGLRRSRLRDSR